MHSYFLNYSEFNLCALMRVLLSLKSLPLENKTISLNVQKVEVHSTHLAYLDKPEN